MNKKIKLSLLSILVVAIMALSFNNAKASYFQMNNGGEITLPDGTRIQLDIFYDWEYEPNFRTIIILDVSEMMYINNENITSDYKSDYPQAKLKEFDFLQIADLKTYRFIDAASGDRLPVQVPEGYEDYGYMLDRLIHDNILTRDVEYKFLPTNTSIDQISEADR